MNPKTKGTLKKTTMLFFVLSLVISSIFGIIFIQKYTGNVASHDGYAGNIYSLVLRYSVPATTWIGVYGVSVRVQGYFNQQTQVLTGGGTEEENFLFDCLQPNVDNELYASTASPAEIDFGSIVAATPAEIDAYLGLSPSDLGSATSTFTTTTTISIGSNTLSAPAVYTYQTNESAPATFVTALLKDGNGNFIYASILTNFTEGFNGRIYNYQLLLPIPENVTDTFYFYTDPNDVCPAGDGEEEPDGELIGNVSDTLGNRLEGVIVDVAGTVALSDATGFYNMTPNFGTHNIFAIKEGYQVYRSNVTIVIGNTTIHDIVLVEEADPNPFTGVGTGDGNGNGVGPGEDAPGTSTLTGTDQGPGEVPPVPYVEQPTQIEGTDYIISLNDLKRKIRPDEFLQETIYVFSFKKQPITVTFEIEGDAAQLIDFDKDSLYLEPNSNGNVVLTIFGRAPVGIYNGTLKIDGDLNATVPVVIEIVSKDKLPVEALIMDIETARKELLPAEQLKFKTDLRNLLIEYPYPVELFFTIQHADGGPVVWQQNANTYLRTAFSIIKTADLPSDLAAGDYILRVTASYLGVTSGSSTLFTVNVPFWQRILFGLRYWHWFLILLTLLAIAAGAYWYWRRQYAKKKFHIKVEMSELPAPGPRSIPVGKIAETEHKTYFNLEQFKTHTIVAGSTGGGKSVSAQVIIEEALEKGVAVIAFDPTAQWTGMLRPSKDKIMLSLFPLYGMKKTDARGYPGNVRMILDAREKLDLQKYVKPGEIQVFCFHKLDPKDMDVVVANAIRSIFQSGPQENKALKVMFVFDEVHRLLPKFGGSGAGFLQIERACREFRKWGLGVMLISQVLSDFVGTIKANINTEIQMRTRDEGDLERIRQKYGEDVLRSLVKATVGSGMVENPAYNRGQPYFVAFRPLKHSVERMSDEEIQKYNDYNDKMDNLLFSLDQLEKEGVDVFDLKLELKLALDKVKAGNFNMVDVYLEGLTPRIDKQWEKIGKTPKKYERELINLDELNADIAKAKEEHDKAQAANGKTEEKAEKKEIGWKDDVAPDKMLNLTNGMIVISLSSLFDEMSAMKDDDFAKHVIADQKNDFAKWVMNALGDTKLAYNLYATNDKAKMIEILTLKKDGKDLPDAKPPAWLSAAPAPAAAPAPTEAPANAAPEAAAAAAPAESAAATPPVTSAKSAQPTTPTEPVASTTATVPMQAATSTPTEPSAQPTTPPPSPSPVASQGTAAQNSVEDQKSFDAMSKEETPPKKAPYDNLVASPAQAFRLENGINITSVKDLRTYLSEMPDNLFSSHVGTDYNHFADWVQGVFNESGLAAKIRETHTKDELASILSQ